jgi:adenosylcobinamide kinase/adenosylcobinamide-phosphate guanylyltransferase
MKVLYFGGQKSGKTSLAIKKALKLSKKSKPYYIATYIDNYNDKEMKKRIKHHKFQRADNFITIEEGYDLNRVVQNKGLYLIDCLSMWALNNLETKEKKILKQIKKLMQKKSDIVFIINDISSGVIPMDETSRRYVDLCGIVGGLVASKCDEVYRVDFGIETRIK